MVEKDNYNAIVKRQEEEIKKLREKYEKEKISETEIQEKLQKTISFKSLSVPLRYWKLSENVKLSFENDEIDTFKEKYNLGEIEKSSN